MKELRIAEIRAKESADSKELVLVGKPIIFDTPTTICDLAGEYVEVIQRGALDGADMSDVRLLVNHDTARIPLARTPKTMQLSVADDGLDMVAILPDTEDGRSVYTSVKRGDLSGMSFAFTVDEGGDSYEFHDSFIKRTITRIKKLYECSIVSFPAYPQTSVEARHSISTHIAEAALRNRAKCLVNSILLKRI
ncbi:MAG: HK97 family phage prohead protease [Desulfovibrio sp.]|nr:HK97 family phage prohead protease [Desulfovibrio sp.]